MPDVISPFAKPMPDVPVIPGTPPITRPTKEEIETFPAQAEALLDSHWKKQETLLGSGTYDFDWLADRHFFLAGATGPGLGGALAPAVLNLLGLKGSLTIMGRDLSKSINYETGKQLQARAEAAGLGNRFQWLNANMELEGKNFEKVVDALKKAGADNLIYVNTIAAAISGVMPGLPPVYVKDVNEEGLFQWELPTLDERSIEITKYVMGTLAVEFPKALEKAGFTVDVVVFADWRGSLDTISQDPARVEYGRQGSYSTSLYLPKTILQAATSANYGSGKKVMDIFYPVMRTRALPLIPGGSAMANLYDKIKEKEGIRHIGRAELALDTLQVIGRALNEGYDNPFPRLDSHEIPLDFWYYEVLQRINNDENSAFYYKHWLEA